MIEEMKMILDSIGDLTGIALWVVAGLIGYKLVIYLSTAGALIYLGKMLIVKVHDCITREKTIDFTTDINARCLSTDNIKSRILLLLDRVRSQPGLFQGGYLHAQHVDWLEDAIKEKEKNDEQEND